MENILLGLVVQSMLKVVVDNVIVGNMILSNLSLFFFMIFCRVILVKTSDWKTIVELDYPKAAQLAYSSKGTYLMIYEPFMSK